MGIAIISVCLSISFPNIKLPVLSMFLNVAYIYGAVYDYILCSGNAQLVIIVV